MKTIIMPGFLQEAFGESQSVVELVAVFGFGVLGVVALVLADPTTFSDVAFWREALAVVLIFDVLAGAVANLTRGTNDYYGARPSARWVFIAIHFHLPVAALLLGVDGWSAWIFWAYTIAAASIVNLLRGHPAQRFQGGLLLLVGLVAISVFGGLPPALAIVAQLFVFKVVYAFAVDHRPLERKVA